MSKHEKYTRLKRQIGLCLAMGVALFSAAPMAFAATSVVANNQLPTNGTSIMGNHTGLDSGSPNNPVMNIHQTGQNGVIKWESFNVGGSATVNFTADVNTFNTLNYVTGGDMSQIYGTINATGGNIYIVNPSGVQIGNSAQINVGSLYVSTNTLDDTALKNFYDNAGKTDFQVGGTHNADAELMSLGNINATNVTFEGDGRIVIDTERIKDVTGDSKLTATDIVVRTNDADKLILGYDAYVDEDKDNDGNIDGYKDSAPNQNLATVYEGDTTKVVTGYMWVEDVEQLQAINTNLEGNYALRNSIDATGTAEWDSEKGFNPIGLDESGKVKVHNGMYGFSGKFDGIDYNIFGLTINRDISNVGLFGVAHDANINNVTLVGGSITGGSVVGSVVGAALGNTHITNATNSASVTGNTDVGGIVGYSGNEIKDGDDLTVSNTKAQFTNLINTGSVQSNGEQDVNNETISNAGGLIGYMYNGTLDGNSYNLGNVSGNGYNVGGLVGHAINSTIGDREHLVYNVLDVTGAYNVGGIVGNMEGSAIQNAENSGDVTATGYDEETYTFHTNHYTGHTTQDRTVQVANIGGIAGNVSASTLQDVTNSGDVHSNQQAGKDFYDAGNVGGIVGKAVDTDIKNAINRENEIRGAHNVGGVAGYFGSSNDASDTSYTVQSSTNDGGDIMATGARNDDNDDGYVRELVRYGDVGGEENIIGNMGGVIGYLDGDNVYIKAGANRGTVHSLDITDAANVSNASKAANTGGIVGKIDRSQTASLDELKKGTKQAAVSDSYNTGDVRGYMGVGGVAGMMYNGEITSSYNLGTINTTRRVADGGDSKYLSVNMGGIVGDTTEQTSAHAVLYDVYNKGQIGDDTYTFYARHVGGVVGRLSGYVDKAYNTGAIYNGYNVVGGIAGWFYKGGISNSFNTGNITVINNDKAIHSQVGGIVGGVGLYPNNTSFNDASWADWGNSYIRNAYNLGTIRSFQGTAQEFSTGGIVGFIADNTDPKNVSLTIENVYTTGNLYAQDKDGSSTTTGLGSIVGRNGAGDSRLRIRNAYYIAPDPELKEFKTLDAGGHTGKIKYKDRFDYDQYKGFDFATITGDRDEIIDDQGAWRWYDNSTPILNAFLPHSEDYFSENNADLSGIESIQYGTAYDPLLTIIKANQTEAQNGLNFNWQDLGINNDAGIAVYGAGLTLDDFRATGGSGYFSGLIYSDGALNINARVTDTNKDKVTGDVSLGSSSQLYGSSVSINADGDVVIYGTVTATGNTNNGADGNAINDSKSGAITIIAGNVDVYGKLTAAAKGESFSIPGINSMAEGWTPGTVGDPYEAMSDIGNRFAYTTGKSGQNGNIAIIANGTEKDDAGNIIDGNVNLFFGNQEQGLITAGGSLKVEAQGDVFVDSDLDIGGNMTLTSKGETGEVLLTLTNIGKVQADRFMNVVESALNGKSLSEDDDSLAQAITDAVKNAYPSLDFDTRDAKYIVSALKKAGGNANNKVQALEAVNERIAVEYMHTFMHSFDKGTGNYIALNAKSGDAKLTVDMWVEKADGTGKFDFTKYNSNFTGSGDGHTFVEELNNLDFYVNDDPAYNENPKNAEASKYVYVEVSNGEQLKGIQEAGEDALGYNYSLMGDINASGVKDYEAIGTSSADGFTGTFDGRGNRIIGLDATKRTDGTSQTLANSGIFSQIGENGVVKNVNIYSSNFTGTGTAGAVAGVNNGGTVENVTTFGNTVTIQGVNGTVGGIVGQNSGAVDDVEAIGSVIANGGAAGGLVGTNDDKAVINNSYSNSAVTSGTGTSENGLGGVVGVNNGKVSLVDSLGVTNGANSSQVGGIIGVNNGTMNSGYNESIVSGKNNVGGIIGVNNKGNEVTNVVNATSVTGNETNGEHVGGLIGSNSGRVTNGRNNGEITGHTYVGGLVGSNEVGSILTNLVNDSSASITGEQYVGGIAGSNAGEINANIDGLTNNGVISGVTYVGGIAGRNTGMIQNTHNNVTLNVNVDALEPGKTAQYFGGVAGINEESGIIGDATNTADVNANGAEFVGGIVGYNKGTLENMAGNTGNVVGENYVGGVAGKNDQDLEGVDASNTGIVHATNGGAGGIFAENSGNITNSILTNNAIVAGTGTTGATGGIIGVNSGAITYSSLKNEVNGQVVGMNDVGGLIGQNRGEITGGRDAGDGYYKYQIYNNGVIQVGIWNDNNGDHVVDNGELTLGGQGSNIGGLFGINTGKVTAAYNTGAIKAGDSSNVGGIAGQNSGTIDQVFSTIFDNNGNAGKVVGSTNVGGLVGWNAGVLSNAYNTSQVSGTNTVGNLVGQNDNAVKNVYATVAGKLIGNGSLAQNGYVAEDTQEWKDHGLYDGFDFDNDGGSIWKNYDGYGTPLLKVFLTKAFYDPATGQLVSAADGFNAHYNAEEGLIFRGMGTESNYLWSKQIRFGKRNPNWLGYDLVAMPDIPAWEFPGGRWDYLYSDAPFDRNKDFRERKAEINFVDGGMEL